MVAKTLKNTVIAGVAKSETLWNNTCVEDRNMGEVHTKTTVVFIDSGLGCGKSSLAAAVWAYNRVSYCRFKPWLETIFDTLEESRLCEVSGEHGSSEPGFWTKTLHQPFDCVTHWYDAMVNKYNRRALLEQHTDGMSEAYVQMIDMVDLSPPRVVHIPHLGSCDEAPIKAHGTRNETKKWKVPTSNWEMN